MVDKDTALDMAIRQLKLDLRMEFEGGHYWKGYDNILAVKADQYHNVWLVTIILEDLKDIRIFQYQVEDGEVKPFNTLDIKTEYILSAVKRLSA